MASALSKHEKSLESLGNLLKTKREISGLTRRDLVVKTKIPLDQLEAIEDGRLSSLPPVFAKGFLRAYANELGLDAEAILEDYRQMTGGFKNEPASAEPLAQKYVESSVGSSGGKFGLRLLVVMILVVAAATASLVLWPGLRVSLVSAVPFLAKLPGFDLPVTPADPGTSGPSSDDPFIIDPGYDDDPMPSNGNGTERAPTFDEWVSGTGQKDTIPTVTVSIDNLPPLDTVTTERQEDPVTTAPVAAPSSTPGGMLVLTSEKDRVWIQVIIDNSQPQFYLLNTGQKLSWRAEDHIIVTAGQASAIQVNWNGAAMGRLGETPVVERRFPRS